MTTNNGLIFIIKVDFSRSKELKHVPSHKKLKCIVFFLESTMIATKEGTKDMTHIHERTETYGSHFI